VEAAYTTIGGIDYKLTVIPEKEYMQIERKSVEGIPEYLTYTPSDLTGTVRLYPVPAEVGTVTILNSRLFTPCTDLTADVELPKGYKSALIYNLAIQLSPEFPDVKINQIVIAKAMETLEGIRLSNKKRPLPVKFYFLGRNRGIFNINTR
jgi:hypothetical protein